MVLFIYNPKSGLSKIKKNLDYIKSKLESKYNSVIIEESVSIEHFKKIIEKYVSIVNTIVISGGDGSFYMLVNELIKYDKKPNIGYIPTGTACDNARKYKISKNVKKAIDTVVSGKLTSVDLIKTNDFYATYVISKGKLVSVSYNTSGKLKKRFKKLAYFLKGFVEFFKIEKKHTLEIKYDDKIIRDKFLLTIITNSNSVAGFKIAKHYPKGYLNCYFIKKGVFNLIKLFIFGENFLKNSKKVIRFRTNKLSLKLFDDKDHWSIDGEEMHLNELTISNEINCFNIFVNEF